MRWWRPWGGFARGLVRVVPAWRARPGAAGAFGAPVRRLAWARGVAGVFFGLCRDERRVERRFARASPGPLVFAGGGGGRGGRGRGLCSAWAGGGWGCVPWGWLAWAEPESLILAQSERWRHA